MDRTRADQGGRDAPGKNEVGHPGPGSGEHKRRKTLHDIQDSLNNLQGQGTIQVMRKLVVYRHFLERKHFTHCRYCWHGGCRVIPVLWGENRSHKAPPSDTTNPPGDRIFPQGRSAPGGEAEREGRFSPCEGARTSLNDAKPPTSACCRDADSPAREALPLEGLGRRAAGPASASPRDQGACAHALSAGERTGCGA